MDCNSARSALLIGIRLALPPQHGVSSEVGLRWTAAAIVGSRMRQLRTSQDDGSEGSESWVAFGALHRRVRHANSLEQA